MENFIDGSECRVHWKGVWYVVGYEINDGEFLDIMAVERLSSPGPDLWPGWRDENRESFQKAVEKAAKPEILEEDR